MKLSYRQAEYINAVAKYKSVAAASRHMNISSSSVLAAIQNAEAVANTTFFLPHKGQGVDVTPAGREFLIHVRRLLAAGEEFGRAMDQFQETATPRLRVGCYAPLAALVVPPVIRRFTELYGDCETILVEGNQPELRERLRAGDVDMAISYDIGEGLGYNATPICRCPAHALLHREDPDAKAGAISLRKLAQKPHILLDYPETRNYIFALLDLAGNRPPIALRTRSYETIRSAVDNRLGAAILNIRPLEASPDPANVVRIPISTRSRHLTLSVFDTYGDRKPKYVSAFISETYKYFEELGEERFAVKPAYQTKSLLAPL